MNNQNLATKIKDLRTRKGLSQEQLSEETKLSLRTIQRIEKGESTPRGDTLIKLTNALGVTPDDLLEWAETEDRGYLGLLNLSALIFLVQPLLAIIIPLVMWILKREKVRHVDDTGKQLISFQITWILTLYITFIIAAESIIFPFNFIFSSLPLLVMDFSILGSWVIFLYGYNVAMIFINTKRSQKGIKSKYFPYIPFLSKK